jgi:hypothetical protein
VNSVDYSPDTWEPFRGLKVVNGDNIDPAKLVHKYGKEKLLVVFHEVPPKKLIENLPHPFLIYTVKQPPKWVFDYARVNDGRVFCFYVLNKVVRGENLSEEEEKVLNMNESLLSS